METMTTFLLKLIGWYNIERVIGITSLMISVLIAMPIFYNGSILEALAIKTNLDGNIVSHWFLFSGLYLLYRGDKSTFVFYSISSTPVLFVSLGIFIYAINVKLLGVITDHPITLMDTLLSFLTCSIIGQRAITKLVREIIESVTTL